MPLLKGKSRAAFSSNVATEERAGKPPNVATAIAYSEVGEQKRKRKNGLADALRKR